MRVKRTACFVGAAWLVLFVLLTLMTPAHYTVANGTHVVSSGDVNGGTLNVLLSSALRALFYTVVISIIAVALGSVIMGFKPFLRRIGGMRSRQSDQ